MEQKISRQTYVFPAIQDEMHDCMNKERYCDAYMKGYIKPGEKSNNGKKCHQVALAMASPVLKEALHKATDASKQMCCCEQRSLFQEGCFVFDGCIILAEASYQVVDSLIRFIYGEEIPENREFKNEITEWLNVLKIENYWHDQSMESECSIVESVDITEGDTSKTEQDMLARGGYQCIACKNATFKNNKKELYMEHLSQHKNSMLEHLKDSKKNTDIIKKYFCDMCHEMVTGADYGGHIRKCFVPIKEELDRLTKDCSLTKNLCETNQNEKLSTNKATSLPSNHFSCSLCNRLFRYKLALKKHVCSNNTKAKEPHKENSSMPSTNPNPSNGICANPMLSVNRSNAWDSSSEEESREEHMDDFDNGEKHSVPLNQNGSDDNSDNHLDAKSKPRGRPLAYTRLPKLSISRKNLGSGDCPECGESYPNKEILKLHTCKSYLGLETENTYRADRQNVELFSRKTQRRSLEESPPASPATRHRKKRAHRSRTRSSRSKSSCSKRSGSKSSTKSGDMDMETNLDNHVSTSEDEECNPSSNGINIKKLESFSNPTTGKQQKTILSSIISENQIQESSETDDNGSIITRAINSLDKEMGQSSSSVPSPSVSTNSSENVRNSCLDKATINVDLQSASSSGQYSINTKGNWSVCTPANTMTQNQGKESSSDRRKEEEEGFLRCEQCSKPFSDQTLLTDHILEEHDSDPFG